MKSAIRYLAVFATLVSCVSGSKYNSALDEINTLRQKNTLVKAYADSVKDNYIALKSDYNNLSYDFEETQRYVTFSERDILKELNKEKATGKKNADIINQLQTQANLVYNRSILRANTFSAEAMCLLGTYSKNKFILLNKNILTLDIEGLMVSSKDNQSELRNSLKDLLYSLHNREDVIVSVSLYQSGMNSNWNKVTMQQELLGFLVSEAQVSPSKVVGLTKLITKEKSLEFGMSTDSRLLLELEFKG